MIPNNNNKPNNKRKKEEKVIWYNDFLSKHILFANNYLNFSFLSTS